MNNVTSQEQLVVDSGTALHIHRDKHVFETISNAAVSIRGVSGVGKGYKGILKQNKIGTGVPAIWYKDLPVQMLISTEGLKRDNWETHFLVSGDKIVNRISGAMLPIEKGPSGLPIIVNLFSTEEDAFVCTPVSEVDMEEVQVFNTESIPRGIRKALKYSINNLQKIQRETKRRQRISKLVEHRRMCHFHEEGRNVTCHDCLLHKGRKLGHVNERSEKFRTPAPLMRFSTDFFGKVEPTSYRGNKWVMLYICDECGYARGKPLAKKSEAPEALESFVKEIRKKCGANVLTGRDDVDKAKMIVAGIRSDNEPVLRSQAWKDVCERLNIEEIHSVPYEPEMNGTCERFVQSIKAALRTTSANTDPRLWDFALEHVINVWNLRKCKRTSTTHCCTPEETVSKISSNPLNKVDVTGKKKYPRRYGCLAYFKPHIVKRDDEAGTALQPKRKRGVHLGFSRKNSAWLIGVYDKGSVHVHETRSVTFIEDILVRNVQELNKPEPPLFEQLLEHSDAVAGESAAAGTGVDPVTGVGARDWHQGVDEIKWETSEDCVATGQVSGSSDSIAQIDFRDDIVHKKEDIVPVDKDSSTAMDIDPGKTSFFSQVRDIAL